MQSVKCDDPPRRTVPSEADFLLLNAELNFLRRLSFGSAAGSDGASQLLGMAHSMELMDALLST